MNAWRRGRNDGAWLARTPSVRRVAAHCMLSSITTKWFGSMLRAWPGELDQATTGRSGARVSRISHRHRPNPSRRCDVGPRFRPSNSSLLSRLRLHLQGSQRMPGRADDPGGPHSTIRVGALARALPRLHKASDMALQERLSRGELRPGSSGSPLRRAFPASKRSASSAPSQRRRRTIDGAPSHAASRHWWRRAARAAAQQAPHRRESHLASATSQQPLQPLCKHGARRPTVRARRALCTNHEVPPASCLACKPSETGHPFEAPGGFLLPNDHDSPPTRSRS